MLYSYRNEMVVQITSFCALEVDILTGMSASNKSANYGSYKGAPWKSADGNRRDRWDQ